VTIPTPLLDLFKRGEVDREVRLLAAQGGLPTRAPEQLGILVALLDDRDEDIRDQAEATLKRIPEAALKAFLARPDVPPGVCEFFAGRGITPDANAGAAPADDALVKGAGEAADAGDDAEFNDADDQESATQKLAKMSFTQRLKAASKGTREMRAILIRDPNKMICAAVLSSPKLSEPEVEAIAGMGSVSDDVLRIIGHNRQWMKNYMIVLRLCKNSKTPLALSMNLMNRLQDADVTRLSVDRNVPEPLRVAARKKASAGRG
jgi:hypothetical protein